MSRFVNKRASKVSLVFFLLGCVVFAYQACSGSFKALDLSSRSDSNHDSETRSGPDDNGGVEPSAKVASGNVRVGGREYVASVLRRLYTAHHDPNLEDDNDPAEKFISGHIEHKVEAFNGPCNFYDRGRQGCFNKDLNFGAPVMSASNAMRSGYFVQLCERLHTRDDQIVANAIEAITGSRTVTAAPTDAQLEIIYDAYHSSSDAGPRTIAILRNFSNQTLQIYGGNAFEVWRYTLLTMCLSEGWQSLVSGEPVDKEGGDGEQCEPKLDELFAQSSGYREFLQNKCAACHVSGPGRGRFAHSDVSIAFGEFQAAGYLLVSQNAVSDSHNGSITGGSQNTATIQALKDEWEAEINRCQ